MKNASKSRPSRPELWSAPRRRVSAILTEAFARAGVSSCAPLGITPWGSDVLPETSDPAEFSACYLFAEIFSKLDDRKAASFKTEAALQDFQDGEERCRLTNERLKAHWDSRDVFVNGSVRQLLHAASWKIQSLLGAFCWDDASQYFGWGPGSTTRLPRTRSHPGYKYSGQPESTDGNLALANAAILRSPLWSREVGYLTDKILNVSIVEGSKIITVPKNYKKERTIAVEPCMNMFVQKGIGMLIRRSLRRVGVDLNDQTRNQRLARVGSLSGLLATVDLSMASDTVSKEIVRLLLPPDWFSALDACRSHKGYLPSGELITFEKFSSMGNGFTFELESLIFWALCSAVLDHRRSKDRRLAVYGDDIVIETASVPLLFEVLEFAGFKPNVKKTHVQGTFRESCGKHYLAGDDVSPFYVKRPVEKLTDLFLLHNSFYRWCERRASYDDISQYWPVIEALRSLAPAKWRKPRIPDGFGDGAFIGSFDECVPKRACHGLEGYVVKHLSPISEGDENVPLGYLMYSVNAARGDLLGSVGSSCSLDSFVKANVPEFLLGGSVGRVPLPPRVREVKSLVLQFSVGPVRRRHTGRITALLRLGGEGRKARKQDSE